MVLITSQIIAMLSMATFALSVPFKRDVAQVESDIATITTLLNKVDMELNAFPDTGGIFIDAAMIHSEGLYRLTTTLQTATTDTVAASPFSEADGATILAQVKAIEPTILDALTVIVKKKPVFDALPFMVIPSSFLQDLKNLNTSTAAFADALIAKSPADLVAQGTAIKTTLVSNFNTAIAAYTVWSS